MSKQTRPHTFLTAWAVRNRAVTLMLSFLVVLGGIWSVRQLNMEMLPNFDVPLITVLTIYPGASSEAVLNDVTAPIENAVSGTAGLKDIQSTSESGISVVIAEFDYATSVRDAKAAIDQRISEIQLPSTALAPKVSEFSFDALPIVRLSLTTQGDISGLRDTVETQVLPRVATIDGVSRVDLVGGGKQQVTVSLDATKMADAGTSVSQIVATLQANNIAISSGDIQSDQRDIPVLTTHLLQSLDDIGNLVVVSSFSLGLSGGFPELAVPTADSTDYSTPSETHDSLAVPQIGTTEGNQPAQPATGEGPQTYTVEPGDTLWDIAGRFYGDPSQFPLIEKANVAQIGNPSHIQPGMVLIIPPLPAEPAQPVNATEPAAAASAPTATPGAVTQPVAPTAPPASTIPSSGLPSGIPIMPSRPEVRIRDVAAVELSPDNAGAISRTNGRPSIGMLIYKGAGANTVKIADRAQAAVRDALSSQQGIDVVTVSNQATYVKASIDGLLREGLLGAVFAIFVIFAFLGSLRSTVVTAISIPASLLVAMILLHWRGDSLNIMTLGALAVATGRVVDDAIVVLENIFRHTQKGEAVTEASVEATGEVARAITASTLTTVAVFLPLGFVSGLVGRIFLPFALTVTFALLASLLVALFLIPTLATFLVRPKTKRREGDTLLQRLYTPAVRWSLAHRLIVLAIAGTLFVGSLGLLRLIGTTFLPSSQEKSLEVRVELPAGTDLAATEAIAAEVEKQIAERSSVETYETTIGNTGSLFGTAGFGTGNSATADIFVLLRSDADAVKEAAYLREAMADLGNRASITVSTLDTSGAGSSNLEIVVTGEDYTKVGQASQSILKAVSRMPDLENLQSDLTTEKPEIAVRVDPEKAAGQGLTAAQVALQIRDMLAGQKATTVNLPTGPLDVFVQVRPSDTASIDKLKTLSVGSVKSVRLSDIADVQEENGPARITRRDRNRAVTITGAISSPDTGEVSAQVKDRIAQLRLDSSVNVQFGGVIEQQTEGFSQLGMALVVAVVLVYIVMVATMSSLVEPLVILVSLPLASIGALLALFVTGRPLSMSALIGLLMLIGIVVTNAIVLLDLVRQLRSRGLGVSAALVEAGRTRIRPILMTAGATVLALMPLALGFNEGSVIATELATVVIGGLLTSTLLTLLVVPVVYSLLFERHQATED